MEATKFNKIENFNKNNLTVIYVNKNIKKIISKLVLLKIWNTKVMPRVELLTFRHRNKEYCQESI